MNWFHDNTLLDNSATSVRIREEVGSSSDATSVITVTSARVVDSGLYTCNVVVNIPESEAISINQTANVIIDGKGLHKVVDLIIILYM